MHQEAVVDSMGTPETIDQGYPWTTDYCVDEILFGLAHTRAIYCYFDEKQSVSALVPENGNRD
jgi:hypothetical protein